MSNNKEGETTEKPTIIEGPLPGDKIVRPVRKEIPRLRKALGIPGLYSIAYGDVGSSIYYALGIVAVVALGATPIALCIAGIFFIFTALTYMEGATMLPKAGGSYAFSYHAFNPFIGFINGWVLFLVYVVTISISALSAAFYLSYFFPIIKQIKSVAAAVSIGIIFFLMILNIIGIRESANFNIVLIIFDLLTQILLVILGFILLLNFERLIGYIDWSGSDTWPKLSLLPYAICVGMVGYIGIETSAQMAQETKHPGKTIPKALILAVITVIVMFLSIPIVALSAMHPQELKNNWYEDPVAGIAHYLPTIRFKGEYIFGELPLNKLFGVWVAILAPTILIIACNAALMAGSRLSFALAENKQLPDSICSIHSKFRTPFISIMFFSIISMILLIPGLYTKGFLLKLGDLYRFAAMLTFSFAHISIIALRIKEPDMIRPFKAPLNISIGGKKISLTAIIGLLSTFSVWIVIIVYNPWGRWIGFLWLLIGMLIYIILKYKEERLKNGIQKNFNSRI